MCAVSVGPGCAVINHPLNGDRIDGESNGNMPASESLSSVADGGLTASPVTS
jgi:hypothetical protein